MDRWDRGNEGKLDGRIDGIWGFDGIRSGRETSRGCSSGSAVQYGAERSGIDLFNLLFLVSLLLLSPSAFSHAPSTGVVSLISALL